MEEIKMAKKKLKICFKLVLDNESGIFDNVTPFKPDSATDLLGYIRESLNKIYGIPVGENKGFQNLQINSFNAIDTDVEDTTT